MPSDERLDRARVAIARPLAVYRSAVVGSLERVRGVLASATSAPRAELELGAFARGRIDAERFATLARGTVLDAAARARITHAAYVLEELVLRDQLLRVLREMAEDRVGLPAERQLLSALR